MDTHSTTLPIDWDRLSPTWRAILVAIFDAGVMRGNGEAVWTRAHEPTRNLLWAIMDRYEAERDAAAAWLPTLEPTLTADELPGWLLSLQRQKEAAS